MNKIIPIFVPHQGCPQRCVYCHQPHITGVPINTPLTPADIRKTIEIAVSEPKSKAYGAQFEAAFYGGTFTGLDLTRQEQLLQTVQSYIERGDLVGIRVSTHPQMFTEQIFALLSAFTVTTIELGVQSFDNDVLTQTCRGYTAEDVEHTVVRLQQMRIAVGVHLMIGLPGDSAEKSLRSADRTIAVKPASVRIHPTLVLRDTELARLYQQGQYTPLTLTAAIQICKDILKLFTAQHIPVIRIGLQPTISLEQQLVAGPYHPAFRQLVDSALMYDQMASLCAQQQPTNGRMTFYTAPRDLSTARGQKKENIHKLQQRFELHEVRIEPADDLERGMILSEQEVLTRTFLH